MMIWTIGDVIVGVIFLMFVAIIAGTWVIEKLKNLSKGVTDDL